VRSRPAAWTSKCNGKEPWPLSLPGMARCERIRIRDAGKKAATRRARADDAQIHHASTRLERKILRRGYQLPANSGSLPRWLHGKKAQIAAVVARLDVNASRYAARIFRYKKRAAAHVRAHAQVIDAITVEDDLLDDEGGIDQFCERFDVVVRSLADADISRPGSRACVARHWMEIHSAEWGGPPQAGSKDSTTAPLPSDFI